MSGITDINRLLGSIQPVLLADEYIFCTFAKAKYGDYAQLDPIAAYAESEGLTLIINKDTALANDIPFETSYRAITLTVHSSLDAVGLTAAVSTKLAAEGISANVVAAYFHDHIFVPTDRADDAVNALEALQRENMGIP